MFSFPAKFCYFSTNELGKFWIFFPSANSINFSFLLVKFRQIFDMKEMGKNTHTHTHTHWLP
jgi:hypothetical protein